MPNTLQLKQRIKTTGNIAKITKAMEMVSASKMKKAQNQAVAARPYAEALQRSLATLSAATDSGLHPFLKPHQQGSRIAVIISTDKGLCGALNTHLFKKTMSWYNQRDAAQLVIVGKKSVNFARFMGLDVHAQFTDLPEKISISDTLPISNLVMQGFLEKRFRSVDLVYMNFVNTLLQKVKVQPLLPLPEVSDQEQLDDQAKTTSANDTPQKNAEYIFEPSPKEILEEILPFYVENSVFHAFLEAKASEHSARMVSMKNANENAKDLKDELKLEYNKSRQAAVTSELLDITTARMAT